MPLLLQISEDGLLHLFSNLLDIRSLSALDIAISCRPERLIWLTCLRAIDSAAINTFLHFPSSIKWLTRRDIKIKSIQINPNYIMEKIQFEGLITSSVRIINLRGCNLPSGILTFLALACPLLQHVDLEECIAHDADVIAFSKKCLRLEWISLNFSRGIEATGFVALTAGCPLLSSIDCSGFKHFTNTELTALARGCPSLKRFILDHPPLMRSEFDVLKYRCPKGSFQMYCQENTCKVSDDGIIALVRGCPQLEIIHLNSCMNLTSVSIAAIGACCPLLKSIDVGAANTGDAIAALAQGCPQLNTIRFSCPYTFISGEWVEVIHTDVTDEGISVLAQCCPKLHTIDLIGCTQVTDVVIQSIAVGCPLLKVLFTPDTSKLTGASLTAIGAGCPLLEEISYSEHAAFRNADFYFLFSNCPKLRIVECSNHDERVQLLSNKCPNLQYVSLGGDGDCELIGAGCHRLEVVVIESGTSDVGIKAIARGSPLLSDIRLRDCDLVTDEGISVLAQCCPKLHTIDLIGCTQVTDVVIQSIAVGCPLLKTIYLNGCLVSEEGVDALIKSCKQLIFLSLNNPSIALDIGPKLTLVNNAGVEFDHSDCSDDVGSDEDDYGEGYYSVQEDDDEHDRDFVEGEDEG